jgi:subtilase family serine protease
MEASMSGKAKARHRSRSIKNAVSACHPEPLEPRMFLSASGITVKPSLHILPDVTSTTPYGYTPVQIKAYYGFGTSTTAGAGETIAIVDAYNDPNISSDLATCDKQFGLSAPPSLSVVDENGPSASLPATNAGWDTEISLDVEWAHAIAPAANILLVEANSSSLSDLLTSVQYATTVANVATVSMSWGSGEFNGESSYDSYFTTPAGHQGITFISASGDEGSDYGPEWPASSYDVLSVGGTSLSLTSGETTWNGSTGGVSQYELEPGYQSAVQTTGHRESPDVAYDANPNTGVAVYDSVPYENSSGWFEVGGTSVGAPSWAALVATADSERGSRGSLNGATQTLPTLYSLYSNSTTYSQNFNDITSGSSSGLYSATTGYDLVTGLGSPKAATLISTLAASTTTTPITTISPPSSGSTGGGGGGGHQRYHGFAVTLQPSPIALDSNISQAEVGSISASIAPPAFTLQSSVMGATHQPSVDATAFSTLINSPAVVSQSVAQPASQDTGLYPLGLVSMPAVSHASLAGFQIAAPISTASDAPANKASLGAIAALVPSADSGGIFSRAAIRGLDDTAALQQWVIAAGTGAVVTAYMLRQKRAARSVPGWIYSM